MYFIFYNYKENIRLVIKSHLIFLVFYLPFLLKKFVELLIFFNLFSELNFDLGIIYLINY
jgi:hypothetical protein